MPYFTFKISSEKDFEQLGTHEKYQQAREQVRQLRETSQEPDPVTYRLVHAKSAEEGIKLLSIRRDDRVIGED